MIRDSTNGITITLINDIVDVSSIKCWASQCGKLVCGVLIIQKLIDMMRFRIGVLCNGTANGSNRALDCLIQVFSFTRDRSSAGCNMPIIIIQSSLNMRIIYLRIFQCRHSDTYIRMTDCLV